MADELIGRLVRRAERVGACLVWRGAKSDGYGTVRVGSRQDHSRKTVYTHRLMYQLTRDDFDETLEISHIDTCRRRDCIEPAHLIQMTHREVIERGATGAANRAVLRCPRGHDYDEANTHLSDDGRRHCRACDRERKARKKERAA